MFHLVTHVCLRAAQLVLRMYGAQVAILGNTRNVPSVREHREHSLFIRNNDVYLACIKLIFFGEVPQKGRVEYWSYCNR
jgi:hypothetical protein